VVHTGKHVRKDGSADAAKFPYHWNLIGCQRISPMKMKAINWFGPLSCQLEILIVKNFFLAPHVNKG
jgi:hypothetical protein